MKGILASYVVVAGSKVGGSHIRTHLAVGGTRDYEILLKVVTADGV